MMSDERPVDGVEQPLGGREVARTGRALPRRTVIGLGPVLILVIAFVAVELLFEQRGPHLRLPEDVEAMTGGVGWAGLPVRARHRRTGIVFRLIPPGEFTMGCPRSEDPRDDQYFDAMQHRVRITRGFYLGETEVTQEQWESVMGDNPSEFHGPRRPVESVSWDEAAAFMHALNAMPESGGFRLPTEAEWEYSCRAGTTTAFYFGPTYSLERANLWTNWHTYVGTMEVGSFPPNMFGLYDMHGNVWEFCSDWYDKDYYQTCATGRCVENPQGPAEGAERVIRGGSWFLVPENAGSATRLNIEPSARLNFVGFRVARTVGG